MSTRTKTVAPQEQEFSTLLDEALDRRVTYIDQGREKITTRRELFVEQLTLNAIKMKPKAVDTVIKHQIGVSGTGKEARTRGPEERTDLLPNEQAVWDEFVAIALEVERLKTEGKK